MAFSESSGNYVGGYSKKISDLNVAKSSNQETWSFSNISTLIVELYLQGSNDLSALGLRSSPTEISSNTHYENYGTCSWKEPDNSSYCFDNLSNKMYVTTYMMGDTRRVFVFHNRQNGQMSIYPAHLFHGRRIANDDRVFSTAHIGTSNGIMNNWVTHKDGDGNIYKSITVDSNNKFITTTLSVKKGYTYTFNMHTVSEAGCDGIIISARSLNSSVSVSDGGNARCSGVNAKSSYTYYASKDGSLYIYFKTNSSNLTNSYQTTDSNGSTINKGCTTGDIEIIVEPIKTTVTLNTNGSSNGTTSIEIPYGTDMSTISITPPTGKPSCGFVGYYTGSSRNLPGKKYIDSNGKGVNGLTWDMVSGSVTLYALYSYSRALAKSWYPLHCIYCTSSAVETSTLQTETSFTLGEIEILFIEGTLSYEEYNISSGNHLSNLNIYNNTTLVIPEGSASGDYKFGIKYKFTPSDTSVFIKEETQECQIWITPTYIVDETMNLLSTVSNLQQKEDIDIPAGSFTLNNNNVSEYFEYPKTIPSTTKIVYNNGSSESSTPQITWSISNPITFDSLGTTITPRGLVTIPDDSNIHMIVPKHVYDGSYYDNRNKVIEIVSKYVSRGIVSYFSRFSDLGVNNSLINGDYGLNNVNIINDLETEYSITINKTALKDIYSVDLLCKYLYEFHNIGNGLQSNAIINPSLIDASYNSTQVYREANEVTNLHISVTENPIYAGETTTWNTKADFTSGSEGVSVNGLETFSNYDASIIQIDNT